MCTLKGMSAFQRPHHCFICQENDFSDHSAIHRWIPAPSGAPFINTSPLEQAEYTHSAATIQFLPVFNLEIREARALATCCPVLLTSLGCTICLLSSIPLLNLLSHGSVCSSSHFHFLECLACSHCRIQRLGFRANRYSISLPQGPSIGTRHFRHFVGNRIKGSLYFWCKKTLTSMHTSVFLLKFMEMPIMKNKKTLLKFS